MVQELSLRESRSIIDVSTRRKCKACGLYLNQYPIFDIQKKSSIFWVGLSSVFITEENDKIPLSPRTKSGALISKIEEPFKNNISFYKTNIVKCLPLFNDKLRYPLKHEMDKCYPNLKDEIATLKPTKIFLLGTQVAQFILSKYLINTNTLNEHFNYELYVLNNIVLIPIHHPSFVLIYRRKNIDNYIKGVSKLINEIPISQH